MKQKCHKLWTMIGFVMAAVWMMACSGTNNSNSGILSIESKIDSEQMNNRNASGQDEKTADDVNDISTLEVHYLDVGQGDATLIICDGHAMLIDAGDNDKGTAVQSYLMSQKIETLDYCIGTHPDADHIGGMDVVITKFDCAAILLTDETKDTNTYRDVIDAIKYKSYKKTTPKVGDTYRLGEAEFTIVGPSEQNSDSNDNSIALILQHGENRFYFEGDAGEKEEAAICQSGIALAANVYKIGHHGSKTSTSDEMLEKVNPAFAVISVGENSYGHPNAEVLNKLRIKGIQVFRTDEQGTIVASSDGKTITWNMQPDDSWKAGEPTGSAGDTTAKAASGADTSADNPDQEDADANVIVHITAAGEKYHQAGCQYLKKSDYEITLKEAKAQGLTPCSKCKPPQ